MQQVSGAQLRGHAELPSNTRGKDTALLPSREYARNLEETRAIKAGKSIGSSDRHLHTASRYRAQWGPWGLSAGIVPGPGVRGSAAVAACSEAGPTEVGIGVLDRVAWEENPVRGTEWALAPRCSR